MAARVPTRAISSPIQQATAQGLTRAAMAAHRYQAAPRVAARPGKCCAAMAALRPGAQAAGHGASSGGVGSGGGGGGSGSGSFGPGGAGDHGMDDSRIQTAPQALRGNNLRCGRRRRRAAAARTGSSSRRLRRAEGFQGVVNIYWV